MKLWQPDGDDTRETLKGDAAHIIKILLFIGVSWISDGKSLATASSDKKLNLTEQ